MRLPQDYRSLARVLKSWSVAPAADPSFRAKVWRRVESGEGKTTLGAYLRANARLVILALILAIALGGFGGWAEAEKRADSDRTDLAAIYVHGLDARWMRSR